ACYGLPTTGEGAASARLIAGENGTIANNGPGSTNEFCDGGTASTTNPTSQGNSTASGTARTVGGCFNSAGLLAIANNDGSANASATASGSARIFQNCVACVASAAVGVAAGNDGDADGSANTFIEDC